MPRLSIIVPVYNTAKYLKQCLDSLINQTLEDIEIIIVNDCSLDNSLDIIKSYKDKRVKLIEHKENMGIGRSRNDALEKATGEFLGFVDSDDFVDLDMYEKYYNFAKKNKLDIVTGYYKKVFDNRVEYFKNEYFGICNLDTDKNIINLIDYGPCNKIFKRKLINEYRIHFEERKKFEDVPFVLNAVWYSKRVGHINETYYNYRIRGNSETTTIDKRTEDIFFILNQINASFGIVGSFSSEVEYFNITQITRYMLKQKHQIDKETKKRIINRGYNYLNKFFPNWKNNKYYKKESIIKRLIKNNKFILKIYCIL